MTLKQLANRISKTVQLLPTVEEVMENIKKISKKCPDCYDGKRYEYQNIGLGLKDRDISNEYPCPKCKGTGRG